MSEKECNDVEITAEIYRDMPPYLRGKIDGYAEAIKERRSARESSPQQSLVDGINLGTIQPNKDQQSGE